MKHLALVLIFSISAFARITVVESVVKDTRSNPVAPSCNFAAAQFPEDGSNGTCTTDIGKSYCEGNNAPAHSEREIGASYCLGIANMTAISDKEIVDRVCTGTCINGCKYGGEPNHIIHASYSLSEYDRYECTYECNLQDDGTHDIIVHNLTSTCPQDSNIYGTTQDKRYESYFCGCPDENQKFTEKAKLNPNYLDCGSTGTQYQDENGTWQCLPISSSSSSISSSSSSSSINCPSHSSLNGVNCYCDVGYINLSDNLNSTVPICTLLENNTTYYMGLPHMSCSLLPQIQSTYNDYCRAANHEKAILDYKDFGNGTCYFESYKCTGDKPFIDPFKCPSGQYYDHSKNKCIKAPPCQINCVAELTAIKSYCNDFSGGCDDTDIFCFSTYKCNDADYNQSNTSSSSSSSSNERKCFDTKEFWNGRACVCKDGYYMRPTSLFCQPKPNNPDQNSTPAQQTYNQYLNSNKDGTDITKEVIQKALEDALTSYKASTTVKQDEMLEETNQTNTLLNKTNDILKSLLSENNSSNNLLEKIYGDGNKTNDILGQIANLLKDINESNSSVNVTSGGSDNNNTPDSNSSDSNNSDKNSDDEFKKLIKDFTDSIQGNLNDLNATIENIRTNGFSIDVLPTSSVDTCPYNRTFELPSPMNSIDMNIDICAITSKTYSVFYFVFYIMFFISGMYLIFSMIRRF